MEPPRFSPRATRKSRRRPWRAAALTAAGAVTLAGCGAGASGAATAPSTRPPTTTAPSAPAPAPGGTTGAAAAPATTADVGIVNFKFTPAAMTVKVGTTVVWTNKDAIAHTVNFTAEGINSPVLNQNDQFRHTFTTPGTFDYICSIHPFMHGSVTVTT